MIGESSQTVGKSRQDMKKVAVVFVIAVLLPSFCLAWLAILSLNDQQYLIERQQAMLYQSRAYFLAEEIKKIILERQSEFSNKVESLQTGTGREGLAFSFDDILQAEWPLSEVGFAVTSDGRICSPSMHSRPEARRFLLENERFLSNRETAPVYTAATEDVSLPAMNQPSPLGATPLENVTPKPLLDEKGEGLASNNNQRRRPRRIVVPLKQSKSDGTVYSRFTVAEAEFHQLVGENISGSLARYIENNLKLIFWHRSNRLAPVIFGTQVNMEAIHDSVRKLFDPEALKETEACFTLLDHNGKPVAQNVAQFTTEWNKPFVAAEIGALLPHWEVAVYLLNPSKLNEAARTIRLTLGLMIAIMIVAIVTGGYLILKDTRRQLAIARQKTDFVSNVSHELKTPLTSIRMFCDLLAEGKIQEEGKRQAFLQIISSEAGRLTRLINNVLDFAKLDRGEKKYAFRELDLGALVNEIVENYRPHLETAGFKLDYRAPQEKIGIQGDPDALAQVIVNLLSNAEKYSKDEKDIVVEVGRGEDIRMARVRVLDRGPGVPKGSEAKIFEQFYRADDSLSHGVEGSGLGLTLARQIARAHQGDVLYDPRPEGGSCFTVLLPLAAT
jgi:signal transduction histidine kinase